jgi:hypothetical protein
MWASLLHLFKPPGGTDPMWDGYDPFCGLPSRAVDEWLARNPALREEYDAATRARASAHRVGPRDVNTSAPGPGLAARKSLLRSEPVEYAGCKAQGEKERTSR